MCWAPAHSRARAEADGQKPGAVPVLVGDTQGSVCLAGAKGGGKIELGLQGEGNLISTQREAGEKHAESRDECAQKQSGQKWTHLRTGEDAAQAWPGLESVMARMWWPGISVGEPRQGMALGQL